jgi:hypothetical protein
VGIVALALLIVAGLAFAFGPVDLPSRAELRREARQARIQAQQGEPSVGGASPGPSVDSEAPVVGSETPSPVPEPASVEEAFDALQATIAGELSSGQLSEDAAEHLSKEATHVFERYQEGDVEKLQDEFAKLSEELDKAVDEGEVASVEAFERIEAAITDLGRAIQADPPEDSHGRGHGGDDDGNGEGNED